MNINSQMMSKDELIKQLQDQVTLWRNKYEALAKLYSQLRTEHLDMLAKFKQFQLKANSAQEAIDRMERMERDVKAKNLELADMIRERDRARFDLDRQKANHKEPKVLSASWTAAFKNRYVYTRAIDYSPPPRVPRRPRRFTRASTGRIRSVAAEGEAKTFSPFPSYP